MFACLCALFFVCFGGGEQNNNKKALACLKQHPGDSIELARNVTNLVVQLATAGSGKNGEAAAEALQRCVCVCVCVCVRGA